MITKWNGKPIAEPGIYSDLPIEKYHDNPTVGPSVSKSGLHTVYFKSPAHYWVDCPWNPDRVEEAEKPNEALNFGKAVHMLLLGEEGFSEGYVLKAHKEFRTKEAKAWRDEQIEAGKMIISMDQLDTIKRMRDSLAAHPLIQQGVLNGQIECSAFSKHHDIFVQSRPDAIPTSSGIYGDLKTTADVAYDDLERGVYKFGYHMQGAVTRMVMTALGLPFEEFVMIFIEKTPPHIVRPMVLKRDALDIGQEQADMALRLMRKCIDREEWPGPQGFGIESEFISIPGWAATRYEHQKALLERMIGDA